MKKTIFTISLLAYSILTLSQNVNGVNLSEIKSKTKYIEVKFYGKGFKSGENYMVIDYGQEHSFGQFHTNARLKDDYGNDIIFNSYIDGLNYMYKQGYELKQVVTKTSGGNNSSISTTNLYILKRD